MKFKILQGQHSGKEDQGGIKRIYLGKNEDVIASETDLCTHNTSEVSPRFELVDDSEKEKWSKYCLNGRIKEVTYKRGVMLEMT